MHKKVLYWSGLVFLVLLSVFVVVSTKDKLSTSGTSNTVSFSGEGKVLARPDIALVHLAIVTEAVTSKKAQDDNSARSEKVVNFLKEQNVEDKDIKTISYNIYPQYTYPRFGQPEITGYQVNQTLEVKIRDLDNVSDILDGAVTAGVNQVNSLSFQIDQPEELKKQAREMAIENAKKKADDLKEQLGIKLGRIVNFSESTGGFPIFERAFDSSVGIGGGGPTVPTGENEVVVNVNLTYQIK
ncbi:MAG: SIMPL domain-containing protein [Candidatus Paceibacterota bacterium]